MPGVTIRNLPSETHRALRVRAARNGRSTEAEIRDILEAAVRPANRVRIGSALSAIGRRAGLTDADVDALDGVRDRTPAVPMGLENCPRHQCRVGSDEAKSGGFRPPLAR